MPVAFVKLCLGRKGGKTCGIKFFSVGALLFVSHICTLMQGGAIWIKFTFYFTISQISAEINSLMLNPEKALLCFVLSAKAFWGLVLPQRGAASQICSIDFEA